MLKISIITVCYNSAATLADTLRSVADQDYPDKEHLIIDGGSTDGTLDILRRHPHLHWQSAPDRGVYDAMNKGIAKATGDVIAFLNADDIYADPGVLGRAAAIFADPGVDACYADLVYVDRERLDKIVRYWQSRPYRHGLSRRGWMPAHPTFMVRSRIYAEYGGFDLEFPRQADFELTTRFLEIHRIRAIHVPEIWVRMRMGGLSNNSLSGIIKGNLEAYRACRKLGMNVNLPGFILRKVLSRLPQFLRRPEKTIR